MTKAKQKKYFWMRLDKEFFESTIARKIERASNRADAFYLFFRMAAQAIKTDGELYDDLTGDPITPEDIFLLVHMDEDRAKKALETIRRAGGVEDKGGVLYMEYVHLKTGNVEEESIKRAERRERQRAREAQEKASKATTTEANTEQETDAGEAQATEEEADEAEAPEDEQPTTKEEVKILDMKGKPQKLEAEQNEPSLNELIKFVVDHLNEKTRKTFKATTKTTRAHISARVKEGFMLEDFYKVVDFKVNEWKDDTKMAQYLRPETLFGPKFEGYLQAATETSAGAWEPRGEKRDFSFFDEYMSGTKTAAGVKA